MTLRHPHPAGRRQRPGAPARLVAVLALASLSGALLLLGIVLLVSGNQTGHQIVLTGGAVAGLTLVMALTLAVRPPTGVQTRPLRRR